MTQFKHAELLKMYAEDALKTPTPWNLWEVQVKKVHGIRYKARLRSNLSVNTDVKSRA